MSEAQSFLCKAGGISGEVMLLFSGGSARSLGVPRVGQESTPHLTIAPAATQVICSLERVLSNCVPVFFSDVTVLKHRAFHVRHSQLPLSREEEEARVINCGTTFRKRFEALRRHFDLVWIQTWYFASQFILIDYNDSQ